MRLISIAAGISIAALALTGCSGGTGSGDDIVDGGTFTLGLSTDPGTLDPQASAGSALLQMTLLAYDSLVSIDSKGVISGQLAKDWSVDGNTLNFTLNDGITCSDGTPFTAKDVVANVDWVGNMENQSPMLGTFLPVGAVATANSDAEVSITLANPSPFALNGLAILPMVCASAVDNRDALAAATNGTGPFVLNDVAPGDHYDYTLRKDYNWGPDGATSSTKGLPSNVVVKVVNNQTTAANLLLSGDLNSAAITGADTARLEAAKLFFTETPTIAGEMWFNHDSSRAMNDMNLRLAFTKALDLKQLAKVVTSDKGTQGTAFTVAEPVACTGDSVSSALPEFDAKAAASLLDDAGWVKGADGTRSKDGKALAITFVHDAGMGDSGAAAAELAVKAWTDLGAVVDNRTQEESVIVETLFGTGDWDVAWLPLNVSSPDQLLPFASGPSPAEGGSNFGHVDNAEYAALVEKASTQNGIDGCGDWLAAESELVKSADIIPFANQSGKTFGNGAKFATSGQIIPMSIRMLAN